MSLRSFFGFETEESGSASSSGGMMGVSAASVVVDEMPEEAPVRFQAPAGMIGSTFQREYARFNDPEQVPWPGVYTIADDGVSAEYFLEFDPVNEVYVYAEVRGAR